jgi:hypothetical protein
MGTDVQKKCTHVKGSFTFALLPKIAQHMGKPSSGFLPLPRAFSITFSLHRHLIILMHALTISTVTPNHNLTDSKRRGLPIMKPGGRFDFLLQERRS